MTTILDSEYIPAERPYSQLELEQKRQKLYKTLHLSKKMAWHEKTHYFYFVKQNGRKEKEMIEKNCCDIGNCSVSWKLSKTPNNQRQKALNLVSEYTDRFQTEPEYLTYDLVDLEYTFYNWLYDEK